MTSQRASSSGGSSSNSATLQAMRNDGGNIQLMQARLDELYSSLRALHKSNLHLEEALLQQQDKGDRELLIALKENIQVMRKQRTVAAEMVREMRARGLGVDLPSDIQNMDLSPKEEQEKLERMGWPQDDGTKKKESEGRHVDNQEEEKEEERGGIYL